MLAGRTKVAVELVICTILVTIVALNALRRMDYFGDTALHMRMTDASRTALVAKNIAEGNGYTTNDLPAALVDFYDQRGKLHADHWVNADRFPFAAYATAALYLVTQSTSWEIGILVYNLVFFVGFLVLLYHVTRRLWGDRYAAIAALALALLHPYTFQFLYWKDGDMLLLSTACMALLYRYFQPAPISRKFAVGFGTVLAFVFLARPNLGLAFVLFVGVSALARVWHGRTEGGLGASFVRHLTREGLVLGVFVAWLVPFVVHTMHEWSAPLFSANSMYQLPLGTRFGMGTDTWWKYSEPGNPVTLGRLMSSDTSLLISKFTGSWLATIKNVLASYPLEIALTAGLGWWLGRRRVDPDEAVRQRPMRLVVWAIAFALISNLAILPLYSFQDYSFRHYLAFALPLAWIAGGRAIVLVVEYLRPVGGRVADHVRGHARWYVLAIVVGVIGWNLGAYAGDANRLLTRTSALVETHWLATILIVVAVLARKLFVKLPWTARIVVLAYVLVFSCYRPNIAMKRVNFEWFPINADVWKPLRQHTGLVSSFALQGEVAWNTGRKNIPAPEWPMHLYSFLLDHKLEVEDLYIESAAAQVDDGFVGAAPGFEGYARLQSYRTLPGYALAFHDDENRGYPKFKIKPIPKASTVFHLVDRAAVQAITKSPDAIELGDPKNVIYTAHGWDRYVTLEGKSAVAGTNATRRRYPADSREAPYEDSGITFFIDATRRPTGVDLEVYAPQAGSYEFYWNLDLYEYDRHGARKAHLLRTVDTTAPGWQTVHLDVPPPLLRTGLNKLGFRASAFRPVVFCPDGVSEIACVDDPATAAMVASKDATGNALIIRGGTRAMATVLVSVFVGKVTFVY